MTTTHAAEAGEAREPVQRGRGQQAARTATRQVPEARMPARGPGDERGPILSRSGKPVQLRITGDVDPYYIPPELVPPGWTWEWKTKTVVNWEHTQHQVTLAQNGWEPVITKPNNPLYPGLDGVFMPKGYEGPIERGGMILMERDDRLTARSREIDRKRALEPLIASRQQAGLAGLMPPSDIVDFGHQGAQRSTFMRASVERAPGSGAKYDYAPSIDEE